MKTKEQQVEELEKDYDLNNLDCDKIISEDLIKRAKLLKEEIEKGCGETEYYGNDKISENYVCGLGWFCPKCQYLIERLNKIIGEEE